MDLGLFLSHNHLPLSIFNRLFSSTPKIAPMPTQIMAPWAPALAGSIARELEKQPFVSFQFATVDEHGSPHVRTVIHRGFLFDDRSTNVLTFTTDRRMTKYKELFNDSAFELCFYSHVARKQFRLRGVARCIDDTTTPKLKLPPDIFDQLKNSAEATVTLIADNDNEIETDKIDYLKFPRSTASDELEYPLLSPEVIAKLEASSGEEGLDPEEISAQLTPPTEEEWKNERRRIWNTLSRSIKSTFRKPTPGSRLTEEKIKLLDSIGRGVDGASDEDGLENLVVVVLFVDKVDFVDIGYNGQGRRLIYRRLAGDHWRETAVCP